MDFLKEAYDAYSQRIRSPFIGSIFFAFLFFNWKPVWFLLFADVSVPEKFEFFDSNTTAASLYWGPIIVGVLVALALPWVQFGGAWLVSRPTRLLRSHQAEEASQLRIASFERKTKEEVARKAHEEAVADRTIGAAKRQKEADAIGGEELARNLAQAVDPTEEQPPFSDEEYSLDTLDEMRRALIVLLSESSATINSQFYSDLSRSLPSLVRVPSGERLRIEVDESLNSLEEAKVVKSIRDRLGGPTKYSLTAFGYRIADELKAQRD